MMFMLRHDGEACSVSGPHTELSLCSLKPYASQELSIASYFLSLGMEALSHVKV